MTVSTDPQKRRSSPLSREVVLHTALQIIDEEGVDGLSMRRLARALGLDPMSLYRHAATKAELLDAVAERVLAQLTVDITDEDWAALLDFSDQQLLGKKVARRFDEFPGASR